MGSPALINPIISSFLQGRQLAEEKAGRLQRGQQFEEQQAQEKELRQEQFKQQEEFNKRLHEQEQARLDVEKAQHAYENKVGAFNTAVNLRQAGLHPEAISGILQSLGMGTPSTEKSITVPNLPGSSTEPTSSFVNPNVLSLPGGGQFDLSQIPSPEETAQRRIAEAGGIAGAQAQAKANVEQPFEASQQAARLKSQQDLEAAKTRAQLQIERENRASAERVAQISNQTRLKEAAIHVGPEYQMNQLEYGVTPQQQDAIGRSLFSGQVKITPGDLTNPILRNVFTAYENQGYKNPGDDVQKLTAMEDLRPILQKMREFLPQLSKSNVGAATLSSPVSQLTSSGRDIKRNYDSLAANAQQIYTQLEGYSGGRLLVGQLKSETGGFFNLDDTQDQAKRKIDDLEKRLNTRQSEVLKKYTPAQRELIQNTTGREFGGTTLQVQGSYKDIRQGPGGHQIGTNDTSGPDNTKHWFDVQTGQPVQVK